MPAAPFTIPKTLPAAIRAYNRARFAAAVRVVRDLKSEADIRYLLRQLPPWVTSPEWERGDAVQVLLGLLWPALNTFVCSIIKRELEERVQESSDFGHIRFSRLSFGKHSPAIVGIKAVPLHGEDLLAMGELNSSERTEMTVTMPILWGKLQNHFMHEGPQPC